MKRRSLYKKIKKIVVELHKNGKSSNEIGRELGIPGDMVHRWSREYESNGDQSFAGNGKPIRSFEKREIADLKKALKGRQIERDFLKKAVAFSPRATINIQVQKRAPRGICS